MVTVSVRRSVWCALPHVKWARRAARCRRKGGTSGKGRTVQKNERELGLASELTSEPSAFRALSLLVWHKHDVDSAGSK